MTENISPKIQKEFQEALSQAMKKAGVESTPVTYSSSGNTANGSVWYACWDDKQTGGRIMTKEEFIPIKIIFNCPATICYFPDGTREIVKVTKDEEYIKDIGVMACIMKKIFKSRRQFLKLIASGKENEEAEVERILHNASIENIKVENAFKQFKAFTTK